ncbi:MAG: tRNA-guanine transglycosylase [Gemmatimonadetes bacterium]|nr:tRNA-guanine transglycosylase [Gemmatimonadota bacterium]
MDFSFEVQATDGRARAGVFRTPRGAVETPVFMPVGTLASVKSLDPDDLRAMHAQIILANAYHLHLRPTDELVRQMGGGVVEQRHRGRGLLQVAYRRLGSTLYPRIGHADRDESRG